MKKCSLKRLVVISLFFLFAQTFVLAAPVKAIEVSGNIASDTTWTLANSPYVVTGDIAIKHSSHIGIATLTIEPGVEIRFDPGTRLTLGGTQSGGFRFYGALLAEGTEEQPIIFTSNAATPAPGDWDGIYFTNETNDAKTKLEYCKIEYGGQSTDANLYMFNASPTIKNCEIASSIGHGIYLNTSSPNIENCTINNNQKDGIYAANSSSATIASNIFSKNAESCINLPPNSINNISGSVGIDNGKNYIKVRTGNIRSTNNIWRTQDLPYVVTGDIAIKHSSHQGIATLTIEPGVEIRFDIGTRLTLGGTQSGGFRFYGALFAKGTEEQPIIFTSNASTPAPGDWEGIYFTNETNDAKTKLEYCKIEYGGKDTNTNLYLSNASPTINHCTVRASGQSGIIANGNGCDNTVITCSNFTENYYGIHAINGAQPEISNSNFIRNESYGIFNTGAQINAENNWWNNSAGPFAGDGVSGDVDMVPFLTAVTDCIDAPPSNSPPFAPANPTPSDRATKVVLIVEGNPVPVELSWIATDPNPLDVLVFDLYFGIGPDNLPKVAENLATPNYSIENLTEGTIYYWKVIVRDESGSETSSAIWKFVTLGDPPDLIVSDITWEPLSSIGAGDIVRFTAVIENTGTGPVVDKFDVLFKIDGAHIGKKSINAFIPINGSLDVELDWKATMGSAHIIGVVADSSETVIETHEENNTALETLPAIIDNSAPAFSYSSPKNNSRINNVSKIVIILNDPYSEVDDAAVISSIIVRRGGVQVPGSVSESGDIFKYLPATSPMLPGAYTVSFVSWDTTGNNEAHTFSFVIDTEPPVNPTITGGTVISGLIQIRPKSNLTNKRRVILTGTREPLSIVVINDKKVVPLGSGDWTYEYALSENENTLKIWLQDEATNISGSVFVDIVSDTQAPIFNSITPADNSYLNTLPEIVTISYDESGGTGLDLENTIHTIKDDVQKVIHGTWKIENNNSLVFKPAGILRESKYTVSVHLTDKVGNKAAPGVYHFTIDVTPPAAPQIDAVATPVNNASQLITGYKEKWASILVNDVQKVGHTDQERWLYTVTLSQGTNTFVFNAVDRAGNRSEPATTEIVYNNIAPLPVETLKGDGEGNGATISLDWTGYDESVHGDIKHYEIYQQNIEFTDISGTDPVLIVEKGKFTANVTGLLRDTVYWFAVVAVDNTNLKDPNVTSVEITTSDIVAPENIKDLTAISFEHKLGYEWTHSINSANDLAGYNIYFDGSGTPITIPDDQNTWEKDNLLSSAAYIIIIKAVDNDNNESSGVQLKGATLLNNPAHLAVQPYHGYVKLNWDKSTPSDLVKHYALFVKDSDFTSVEGMEPVVKKTSNSGSIARLENGKQYYFAVTTINISDGMRPEVTTVTATPQNDETGPAIGSLTFKNVLYTNFPIVESGNFAISVTDPAGVSSVQFFIDSNSKKTDNSKPYTCGLDIFSIADGAHVLKIKTTDTLGNISVKEFAFTINLPPPPTPLITSPANNTYTNEDSIDVKGNAQQDTTITVFLNNTETDRKPLTDKKGKFKTNLELATGDNNITASAENRNGQSPRSNPVKVILDDSIPSAPEHLTVRPLQNGQARLFWDKVQDVLSGYDIYRSLSSFDDKGQAQKITSSPIRGTSYTDIPTGDSTWYYRVTSVTKAGIESNLSDEVNVLTDSVAPFAFTLNYLPQDNYNPDNKVFGQGRVDVELIVSEELMGAPFFSITPDGGIPIPLKLTKVEDKKYTGSFNIGSTTPSGKAWAVFSARDLVGNRGTRLYDGQFIMIDTKAPQVSELIVNPTSPIQNNEQAPVIVTAI
ncbi:MAG: right-handed parallel beta-helix repeat-containing protein, partial [Desulfobacteraceae bacterium]|nr:right-handed parallel beta-helix repeat-containing protein [Desulfobacteraceae bacterium]